MTTGATATAAPDAAAAQTEPADVFVVFGITGDLAKVMTFRSLYRLEARGLLDCPIVGVAVDDWTVDQLVQRARESIVGTGETLDEDVFKRFAARRAKISSSSCSPVPTIDSRARWTSCSSVQSSTATPTIGQSSRPRFSSR